MKNSVFAFLLILFTNTVHAQQGNKGSSDYFILTPGPANSPRLNNALVYGCGPARDFLYRIPCQGKRPIKFSASELPAGLKLDENTGIITGLSPQKGTYDVILKAKNKYGVSSKKFQIKVEGKLALTPPMGWSSWYAYYDRITDKIIRQTTDLMIETGMADLGYSYVNLDDCWAISAPNNKMMLLGDTTRYGIARKNDGSINTNRHFPDMKSMTTYIHSKGLKAGIYSSPGPQTCMNFEGSYKHEAQDAKQFAEWGFDFLKYDWCSYWNIIPQTRTTADFIKPYAQMGQELNRINRDIIYSLCQYGHADVWKWGASVGGNSWRTAGDLGFKELDKVFDIALRNASFGKYNKPGEWNDPDYISIGYFGGNLTRGYPEKTKMPAWLQYSYMSLWSMMASPIIYSGDLTQIDEFTLNVLCNPEIIEINQDPLGQCGKVIMHSDKQFIMVKELSDGTRAVALFNREHTPVKISTRWNEIGADGKQKLRDVWRQKDLGAFTDAFEWDIPAQGCMVVKLTPIK
ncbi:MAG TPA: putative Ig domain-containing protein [Flavisolibacter sp.]|jgi:alpha-galactosidase|nr:putative Ig domain-containing protein [Flavisolibacter sp.]